jgi:hypothetical protein
VFVLTLTVGSEQERTTQSKREGVRGAELNYFLVVPDRTNTRTRV